jgi:Ca2+-transporting ATPase
VHIVFLELVIDPACAVAFEAEPAEPGVMRRPPRRAGARLFDGQVVTVSLLQGLCVLVVTLAAFRLGLVHTGSEDSGRALAFATLIAGNVALILVNRSWERSVFATLVTRNRASWAVIAGAVLSLLVVLRVPFFASLFRFGAVRPDELALAMAAGVACLSWFEVVKRLRPGWLIRRA